MNTKGISHKSEQNTDEENNVHGLGKCMHFGITLQEIQKRYLKLV